MTDEESLALNVAKVVQLASADPQASHRGFLKSLSDCRDQLAGPIIDIVRHHDELTGTDADRSVRLRTCGVSRHEEYPRSLVVTFTEAVTDDEMRDFHDFTRKWGRP